MTEVQKNKKYYQMEQNNKIVGKFHTNITLKNVCTYV